MELPIEDQLKVLKGVIEMAKYIEKILPFNYYGLCVDIEFALKSKLGKEIFVSEIKNYIPLFTKENAIKFAQAKPDYSGLWWKRYNYKDRLAFLDWMISELEKQLKD